MVAETQTWTTHRNSNHRLSLDSSTTDHLLDIPTDGDTNPRKPILSPSAATTVAVGAWYASNIGVLLLNKYLLSIHGFRYPIFLTMLHMLSSAAYSFIDVHWLSLVPLQPIHSRRQFLKILSLSAIFCFSVVCGNASLRYIPVSFNQAIGATTPFFTAVFAFVITCKKEAPRFTALFSLSF